MTKNNEKKIDVQNDLEAEGVGVPTPPTVSEEVSIDRELSDNELVTITPAVQFQELLEMIVDDIDERLGEDILNNNSHLMVQFKLHEDPKNDEAGQVFLTSVGVAIDNDDNGLIILNAMPRAEYERLLSSDDETAEVLTFAGLQAMLTDMADTVDLNKSQIVVNVSETDAVPFVGGEVTISDETMLLAVPQHVVYKQSEEGDDMPSMVFIQI